MIPFRDVIPSRTKPIVTMGLIALNAAVFLLVPAEVLWRDPRTSFFLHEGWIHVICNLWALWLFGDNVESGLGHWRYLLLCLLTAAAAAAVQVWAAPDSWVTGIGPGGGPGGAIAGVIGGYMVLYPGSRILVIVPRFFSIDLVEVPAVAFAGIWLAILLLLSLGRMGDPATGGGVTLLVYAAGFLTGMGLVWLLGNRQRDRRWWGES
jgi:membrane associated rhomboid family serine protease